MDNLSLDFSPDFRPLAARMRPTSLAEYVGQQHIIGPDQPLRKALEAGFCHSMILWGPPGTGKTTLAELAAKYCDAKVERLSAVTSGVKDIRAAIERAQQNAQQGQRTLLFVDEVHRFNKSQQDGFLPFIEDGTIIFIGATTENPSFELNNALLSRTRVYVLKSLEANDLTSLIERAIDTGFSGFRIQLDAGLTEKVIALASGDGRKVLNFLELMVDLAPEQDGQKQLTKDLLAAVAGRSVSSIDKQGDIFYDLISALHKSIRGSAPDAALYWYARMLTAGCDPLYIARRCLAIASEDVGNADPRAMQVAIAAWDCFSRVGPAEGERAIAQAIVYLACAPKSNAVYTAFKAALRDAKEHGDASVPLHLRNAPTSLLAEMGHGAQYRYAHDEPNAYAAGENYFPTELANQRYYFPTERGLEKQISEKLNWLRSQDNLSEQKRYD
ncbi:replication-associated recombination protein A [Motilimonas eburnea]|uniref:replication-associated recombination protein A n=1 Tax=Motilimonas eburnea TaxID=1737488 RepID=UPI001E5CACD8|nr:replication-associated recombination protein A [Motilimonas eburnea]MCE2573188.1 replication-associated recombination protein A [Motilimonas eburnea]